MKISSETAQLLLAKAHEYNRHGFIAEDPIAVPHAFTQQADIEIAGFLTATIAWGNRKSILTNAQRMMSLMDHAPAQFVEQHQPQDLKRFEGFVHRTFNAADVQFFIHRLGELYRAGSGLEDLFLKGYRLHGSVKAAICEAHGMFFQGDFLPRSRKHFSNPERGSAAKRLNMFLRWMVRQDAHGVDFGLWRSFHAKDLMLPLDVHTGNVARQLGLLHRKANDWKAVEEVTAALREIDPKDPIRLDYALFALGVVEGWKAPSSR